MHEMHLETLEKVTGGKIRLDPSILSDEDKKMIEELEKRISSK